MREIDALTDLLAAINASSGGAAIVSSEHVAEWPAGAVEALTKQQLLSRTRPASTVSCPGCERRCVMPLQTQRSNGIERPFVVCDKRPDINRVAIDPSSRNQWRCDLGMVRSFIAVELGLSLAPSGKSADAVEIGLARGRRKTQMLALRKAKVLELVAGTAAISLAHVLSYRDNRYRIDVAMTRQLVDSSSTGDPRYTPSTVRREIRKLKTAAMRDEWRREHQAWIDRKPGMPLRWYANQIARSEKGQNRSAETIRKSLAS